MAQESFLKLLNCRFIGISAFKCHFMWRVDVLTGGSSFLYQSKCLIVTQMQTFSFATEEHMFFFFCCCSLRWQRFSVSCSQPRPLQNRLSSLSGKIRIHHSRELCARGEFEAILKCWLESIPAHAHYSVFVKSLSLSHSSFRIIIPQMQLELVDGIPTLLI